MATPKKKSKAKAKVKFKDLGSKKNPRGGFVYTKIGIRSLNPQPLPP